MRVNIHVVRAFLPKLVEQKYNHIVITSSIAGMVGVGGLCPYNTSKFANIRFYESLYHEFTPKGIDVSILNPFPLKTNLIDTVGIGNPSELLEGVAPETMKKGTEEGKIYYWMEFFKKQSLSKGFGVGFSVERAVKRYPKVIRKEKLYIFKIKYGRMFQIIKGLWLGLYKRIIKMVGKNHMNLIQETFNIALEVARK